jgi:predicted metal-dependent HD superfamily phosphohydrolase
MLRDANQLVKDLLPLYPEMFIPGMEPYLVGALESHYNQTFRAYHNLEHIHTVLSGWIESSFMYVERPHEFAIAILFHDTIYSLRAKSGENERESADVALTVGPKCFQNIDWQRVYHLILATAHTGQLQNASSDEQLIADLDLEGLGAPSDTYFRNRENVVKEYLTMYTPDEVRAGRRVFIATMLARPTLFYTRNGNESQARANLQEELARMDDGRLS